MNRVATCPTCKTSYELDDEDIGHLMECECGEALFACHTRSLPAFPIHCQHCGGEHQVGGRDAGKTVAVDCGASVDVPGVTLRAPIGTRETATKFQATVDRDGMVAKTDDKPETQEVPGHAAGHAAAPMPPVKRPSVVQEPESANASQDPAKREQAKPRKSLAPTLGFLGVVLLLVVAFVMFLLREPPSSKKKRRTTAGTQTEAQDLLSGRAELTSSSGDGLVGAEGLKETLSWQETETLPASRVTLNDPERSDTSDPEGGYRLPPPPIYALPQQQQARVRVAVAGEKVSVPSLQRGVELAFEEYGKVQELRDKSIASESKKDTDEFHQTLSRALGIIEHVHRLALLKAEKNELATMRYLMAYLYFTAGQLPEACVMGESVARWGDVADPSTREAAMIALAAAQELSETHWGNPDQLGELRQMEVIVGILEARWPKDSQSDLIWMNLGYLYEAFNQPREAIRIYENIRESSEHFTTARLASGMAQWNVVRQQALEGSTPIDREARQVAKQELVKGLRATEKVESGVSRSSLEARLALAQMDLSAGNAEKAAAWLTEDPPAVSTSIRVREDDEKESAILIDEATARQIFDVLFHARNQLGDVTGATTALEDMAQLLGTSGEQVASRQLVMLKDTFARMKQGDDVVEQDFAAAEKLSAAIMKSAETLPATTLLWLGESWAESGESAKDPEIAKECARLGAELFGTAILRTDFPARSMQAAQLRRIELLRRAGAVMESLKQVEEILASEPNVFGLQITAAQSLQQLAVEYGRASDLLAAINGPTGFSPIWGWGKLVTTLHATHYSATGTPRHAEQLSLAQYHLYQCRYLLAAQVKDSGEKTRQLAEVDRALAKLMATMDKKSEWFPRFEALQALSKGGK